MLCEGIGGQKDQVEVAWLEVDELEEAVPVWEDKDTETVLFTKGVVTVTIVQEVLWL